jgi:alpha-mannosidase
VVRVRETRGKAHTGASFDFGVPVTAARELNGIEDDVGPATTDGSRVVFDLSPFQPRTFAATLAAAPAGLAAPASRAIAMKFDTDVVTVHGSLEDGAFDAAAGLSYAGEQWPTQVVTGGATFAPGPSDRGELNAITCAGQAIPIDPQPGERLYLLAAGLGDRTATFTVGQAKVDVPIQDWTGVIRRWDSRFTNGVLSIDGSVLAPPIAKIAPVAAFQTHRHTRGGDDAYRHTYLFRYALDIPAGATQIVLPDDPAVRIFAMSLVDDPGDRIVPVTEIYDGFDPRLLPVPGEILGAAVPVVVPDVASPEVAGDVAEAADAAPDAAPEVAEAASEPGPEPVVDVPASRDAPSADGVDAAARADPGPGAVSCGTSGSSGGCSAGTAGGPAWMLVPGLLAVAWRRRPRGR